MKNKRHDFTSEADLCDTLSTAATAAGWQVYPETGGHDLLLVATAQCSTHNVREGDTMGVQAKLHANTQVLYQALPGSTNKGPSFHAVLVPVSSVEFDALARRLGIVVLEATVYRSSLNMYRRVRAKDPGITYLPAYLRHYYDDMDWRPESPIVVPAGVRSPKTVTPWKVAAVRFCLKVRKLGYFTAVDMRDASLYVERWKIQGWAIKTDGKIGKHSKYTLTDLAPDKKYPEIAAQLLSDLKDEKSQL